MTDTTSATDTLSEAGVRVIAIAALVHRDHVLLAEGHDPVKDEVFYRPLGGGIHFGERATEAAVREMHEETGFEIEILESLGAVENLFTYRGQAGHEIVFEFVAEFHGDSSPTELASVEAIESGNIFLAKWLPLPEVIAGVHRIYPDGLPDRLAEWVNRL